MLSSEPGFSVPFTSISPDYLSRTPVGPRSEDRGGYAIQEIYLKLSAILDVMGIFKHKEKREVSKALINQMREKDPNNYIPKKTRMERR